MNLEEYFMPYIRALKSGIKEENWILSVMCASTLPDICASLGSEAGKSSSEYYINWFNNYVKEYQPTLSCRKGLIAKTLEEWINRPPLKPEDIELHPHVFFTGVNAYALRCAFLHEGNGNISSQPVQKGTGGYKKYKDQILNIENVEFKNDPNLIFNQVGKTAYINPENYCIAVLTGVIYWIETMNKFKDSDRPDDRLLYSTIKNNASKMLMFE